MIENLDPVLLARIQFAFTVAFHIIIPAFTIGLASWLAVVEWRYLKTGNDDYQEIYRIWVKIFAVTFGMGVVSGVVLSYQFGTKKQQQWLWFIGLWFGGLAAVLMLAYLIRWMMRIPQI